MNAQMSGKKVVGRNAVIASGIICILLAVTLVGAIANYASIINAKDNTIRTQQATINTLNLQIDNLTAQTENQSGIIALQSAQIISMNKEIQNLTNQNYQLQSDIIILNSTTIELNATINDLQNKLNSSKSRIDALERQVEADNDTISKLQSQLKAAETQNDYLESLVKTLEKQVDDLTAIINMSKAKLQTLVFHVCEKGEGYTWGRLPNVTDTYNQILALNNNTHNILLLPEYKGNENWTETLAWLTENFTEIPIMLPVFEGGPYDYPVVKLTVDQISEAMEVCDVRWLRISEVVSWYIEHNLPFPAEYVTNILNFCREHSLKVQWSEWKVGDSAFQRIQSYIVGFEDIVTVTFSTNSGELEPADGFLQMSKMFQHWGGSVQAWYWETRHRGNYSTVPENPPGLSNPLNMPISLLTEHALLAKYIGAEVIQFEPYWYFFDNGQANENLKLLETMLTP